MRGRVFKQRAAAQKCGGWRCDLYNAAIAINLLPAVAGDLTSAVDYLPEPEEIEQAVNEVILSWRQHGT